MQRLIFLCLFVLITRGRCDAFEAVRCSEQRAACYCYKSATEYIPLPINGINYVKYFDSIENKDSMTCSCGLAEVNGKNVRCTGNGNFEPVQCEGDTCHCVDPKSGQRLGPYTGSDDHMDKRSCRCAIKNFEEGTNDKCTVDGGYPNVKCDEDKCHCADHYGNIIIDQAGQPRYTDEASNEDFMTCSCAQDEWEEFNKDASSTKTFACTPNGNYETVQCHNGLCHCFDPHNKPFLYFNEERNSYFYLYNERIADRDQMDCNCAIAHWWHVDGGKEGHMYEEKCDYNGNFRPMQCHNDTCFCVDDEGQPILDEQGNQYTMDEAEYELVPSKCGCARINLDLDTKLKCTSDGENFELVQCDGDNCTCTDPRTGEVLTNEEGEAYTGSKSQPDRFNRTITCDCADYFEVRKYRNPYVRCLPNGNFDLVGCRDWNAGHCWCARPGDPALPILTDGYLAYYQTGAPGDMDCECAAAKYMEGATEGRSDECQTNGNWKP